MKNWEKSFEDPNNSIVNQKRLQEIGVLLSELESVNKKAAVFKGSEKTVFFKVTQSSVKSGLKREQNRILKEQKEGSSASSDTTTLQY